MIGTYLFQSWRYDSTAIALALALVIQSANASLALSSSTSRGTSNFRIRSRYRDAAATSPPIIRQGAGDWNTRKAKTNNARLSLSKSTTSSIMMSTRSDEIDNGAKNILHTITTIIGKTASLSVSISFFLLLAYHRNATILTIWIGSILNAILSKIIKKIVNQNRPSELQIAISS